MARCEVHYLDRPLHMLRRLGSAIDRGGPLATYITLGNYTAQGIKDIRESPARLDAAREQLKALGVQIKDFYLTMGQYDLVAVVEAPDNTAAAKALLALGAQGNISTTTLAAHTESEFRALLANME